MSLPDRSKNESPVYRCQACVTSFTKVFSDSVTCTWPQSWPPAPAEVERSPYINEKSLSLDGPVLYPNFTALEESAQAGCVTCQLFRQKLLEDHSYEELQASPYTVDLLRETQVKPQLSDQISITVGHPRVLLFNLIDDIDGVRQYGGLSAEPLSLNPTINPMIQHDDTIRLIQNWLGGCYSSHSACNETQILTDVDGLAPPSTALDQRFLPRRLISIEKREDGEFVLKLVLTDNVQSTEARSHYRYTALSYVWGPGTEHFTTTRDNYLDHLDSIAWEKMPQTFKDSIILTHKLKCNYFWVDALCIIQPDSIDAKDWSIESVRMGETYRCAYVTIAPARGRSVNDGFLQVRSNFEHPLQPCRIDDLVPEEFWTKVGARRPLWVNPATMGWIELGAAVINTRAWCFQERLLSPRTIFVTSHGLVWECYERKALEDQSEQNVALQRKHQAWEWSQLGSGEFDWRAWHSIVGEYSARSLTVASDALPAISGVAKIFAHARRGSDDQYLGGLWKKSLAQDLCWVASNRSASRSSGGMPRDRISGMPSWLWASVPAQIGYPSRRPRMNVTTRKRIGRDTWDPARGDFLLEVVSFSGLRPVTAGSVFGHVQGGQIRVRGQTKYFDLGNPQLSISPTARSDADERQFRAARSAAKSSVLLDLYSDTLADRDWILSRRGLSSSDNESERIVYLRAHRDHLVPESRRGDDVIEQHYLVLRRIITTATTTTTTTSTNTNDTREEEEEEEEEEEGSYRRIGYLVERMKPILKGKPYLTSDDGEDAEVTII